MELFPPRQYFLIVALAMNGACRTSAPEGGSDVLIVNGVDVDATANQGRIGATAALMYESTNGLRQYCTGTLIHPTIVLTAAHCLLKVKPSVVTFDINANNPNASFATVSVASISPFFDPITRANDFAFLTLAQPVTSLSPAKVASRGASEALLVAGTALHLVGYGVTQTDQVDNGIKRQTTGKVERPVRDQFLAADTGTDTCQGDSGGPAFAKNGDDDWQVFGISSWGTGCGSGGYYSLAWRATCWIKEATDIDLTDGSDCAAGADDQIAKLDAEATTCAASQAGGSPLPCWSTLLSRWDAELNRVYQLLRLRVTDPAVLKAAQLAWIKYRDADQAVLPDLAAMDGSFTPLAASYRVRQIRARTVQLSNYLNFLDSEVSGNGEHTPTVSSEDYGQVGEFLETCRTADPGLSGIITCHTAGLQRAETRLNEDYLTLKGLLPSAAASRLDASQTKWSNARDKEYDLIDMIYPEGDWETATAQPQARMMVSAIRMVEVGAYLKVAQ